VAGDTYFANVRVDGGVRPMLGQDLLAKGIDLDEGKRLKAGRAETQGKATDTTEEIQDGHSHFPHDSVDVLIFVGMIKGSG